MAKPSRKCPQCGKELPVVEEGEVLRCTAHVTEGSVDEPLVTPEHPEGLVAHRRPCGWRAPEEA